MCSYHLLSVGHWNFTCALMVSKELGLDLEPTHVCVSDD